MVIKYTWNILIQTTHMNNMYDMLMHPWFVFFINELKRKYRELERAAIPIELSRSLIFTEFPSHTFIKCSCCCSVIWFIYAISQYFTLTASSVIFFSLFNWIFSNQLAHDQCNLCAGARTHNQVLRDEKNFMIIEK